MYYHKIINWIKLKPHNMEHYKTKYAVPKHRDFYKWLGELKRYKIKQNHIIYKLDEFF